MSIFFIFLSCNVFIEKIIQTVWRDGWWGQKNWGLDSNFQP